jgi:hypothetical protein
MWKVTSLNRGSKEISRMKMMNQSMPIHWMHARKGHIGIAMSMRQA